MIDDEDRLTNNCPTFSKNYELRKYELAELKTSLAIQFIKKKEQKGILKHMQTIMNNLQPNKSVVISRLEAYATFVNKSVNSIEKNINDYYNFLQWYATTIIQHGAATNNQYDNSFFLLMKIVGLPIRNTLSASNGVVSKIGEERLNQLGISNIYDRYLDVDYYNRPLCKIQTIGEYNKKDKNSFYNSSRCGIPMHILLGIFTGMISVSLNPTIFTGDNIRKYILSLLISMLFVSVSLGEHNFSEVISGITIIAISLKKFITDLSEEIKIQHEHHAEVLELGKEIQQLELDLKTVTSKKNKETLLQNLEEMTERLETLQNDAKLTNNIRKQIAIISQTGQTEDTEKVFIQLMANSKIFVDNLYNLTRKINPLGFIPEKPKKKDEKKKDKKNNEEKKDDEEMEEPEDKIDYFKRNINDLVYDIWFSPETIDLAQQYNSMLFFTALDNDRYTKEFLNEPNKLIDSIFKSYFSTETYKEMESSINNVLQTKITKCIIKTETGKSKKVEYEEEEPEEEQYDYEDEGDEFYQSDQEFRNARFGMTPADIPFAFITKKFPKNKRTSVRRKSSKNKRTSIRRKSSNIKKSKKTSRKKRTSGRRK